MVRVFKHEKEKFDIVDLPSSEISCIYMRIEDGERIEYIVVEERVQ
jgi:hypothetical protein